MTRSVRRPGQTGAVELPDGEPDCGPWRAVAVADLYAALGRPRVLAVDGRSGSGKSTLAARWPRPCRAPPSSTPTTWPGTTTSSTGPTCSLDGVLVPWRAGRDVAYRPPPWDARGRAGAITVPSAAPLLVVEGVGAGRRAFAPSWTR